MAVIDRVQLLEDVKCWLPPENQLNDTQINKLMDKVISGLPEDDDIYYDEALCKTLQACGKANQMMSSTRDGRKREKVDEAEVEYFNMLSANQWDDWLNNLPCLCSQLGYNGLRSKVSYGFFANVATPVQAPVCNPPYGSQADLTCCNQCGKVSCSGSCDCNGDCT